MATKKKPKPKPFIFPKIKLPPALTKLIENTLPIIATVFPAASIIIAPLQKAMQIGKMMSQIKIEKGDKTKSIVAIQQSTLPIEIKQQMTQAVIEDKPVKILTPEKAQTISREIKAEAGEMPAEKQQKLYTLIDRNRKELSLSLSGSDKPSLKDKVKTEKEKLYKDIAQVQTNIKTTFDRIDFINKRYFAGGLLTWTHMVAESPIASQWLLRLKDIQTMLNNTKKEIKSFSGVESGKLNLGEGEIIAISLDTSIIILKSYQTRLSEINDRIKKLNGNINAFVSSQTKTDIQVLKAKEKKTVIKAERPEAPPFNLTEILMPGIIIIAIAGAGYFIIKSRKK